MVVDVGAHIGKYTLKTAQLVGDNGAVLAIETNPVNYSALERNIQLNNIRNVTALNMAAWNTESELKLFVGNVGGHHSTKINWNLGWYPVRARPMDRVITDYRLDGVDWVKIDVEGVEREVISGLKGTIDKHKPKVIVELSYDNIIKVKNFKRTRVWYGENFFDV
ncbi:MAG: FkbM family methyltransferase [Candidatus Bathyarchaeota archaeon]|nr:FkbM family methyltransferase [Candidatus Bathyarchaeota archaeon]